MGGDRQGFVGRKWKGRDKRFLAKETSKGNLYRLGNDPQMEAEAHELKAAEELLRLTREDEERYKAEAKAEKAAQEAQEAAAAAQVAAAAEQGAAAAEEAVAAAAEEEPAAEEAPAEAAADE